MGAYYDLHMHSCLSPCAEDDMTPCNLVGMAKVKGLDVIALTDHNTARNVPAAMEAGRAYGVAVIPGMEVTSREEVHLLTYFPTEEDALAAGEEVYGHLPDIANVSALFGNQLLMNADDEVTGTLERLLLSATDLSIDDVAELAARHHGLMIPAHINRGSNGMIGALGLMPLLPEYPVVEVYPGVECPAYAVSGRFVLHSGDAHRLEDILERESFLDAEPTAEGVLRYLRKKCSLFD